MGSSTTRFLLLLSTPFPPLLRLRRLTLSLSHSHSLSLSHRRLQQPLYTLSPRLKSQFHSQATTTSVNADHHHHHRFSSSSPLPEWFSLLERLTTAGYFNRTSIDSDSSFVSSSNHDLSNDFLCASRACLAFATDRPNLLRSLPKRDIDVVTANVSPFLFINGSESSNAIRLFLSGNETSVLESTKACTVDLMRFLLSYTYNPSEHLERNSIYINELVESSVRSLLREMANAMYSPSLTDFPGSTPKQFQDNSGQQTTGTFRQNIEMKRGDWICTRCSFMNFARNVKCLECEEARPKRQLTGGEWECPQCDFFNYGKNMVCLRCDCKRPGEASANVTNSRSILGDIDGRYANKLDSTSEHNATAGNFPEIMRMRKGVNRFVVSTSKTPLERRLDNSQYQTSFSNDSTSGSSTLEKRSLDDILGRTSTVDGENKNILSGQNSGFSRGNSSNYVPFVPLPADTFAKKTQASKPMEGETSEQKAQIYNTDKDNFLPSQKPDIQIDEEKEQAEKSERWFKKVAELHDVTDLASAISDEDFPEIMPMRKGENRFVVGKKKDRSLTSPMYKRKMAMEQTGSTNFVPFVPFPPNYFTKKKNLGETPENADNTAATENLQSGTENWNSPASEINLNEKKEDFIPSMPKNGINTNFSSPGTTTNNNWSNGGSSEKNDGTQNTNFQGNSNQSSENRNTKGAWTGKSLEGSAVKELDPLDMSEEAKAERWFRRAAQIKDISELSQIPDEDFPSIMPMRKGVNRFVVSKRKTPLERRLTSPQYRRNLPVVSSEPPLFNKENDSS